MNAALKSQEIGVISISAIFEIRLHPAGMVQKLDVGLQAQIPLGPPRHVTTRTTCCACRAHIATYAHCQLLSFSFVNFPLDIYYLQCEPRR